MQVIRWELSVDTSIGILLGWKIDKMTLLERPATHAEKLRPHMTCCLDVRFSV